MTNDTTSTLADGTRSDVPVPNATKGIRIATRCVTIEQFVETYHQVCEDTAIFIPNTQRSINTVLQFRFNLHDGSPALLGIGTVVEELTTKHNRFNHVGIVVELQRLSRTSEITFEQMLAVRAQTKLETAVPAPVYPRAMTVPIEVIDATKLQRMTTESHQVLPRQVPIPPPVALPAVNAPRIPMTRTKTALGLPAVVMPPAAKKAMDTVRIPAIIAPPAQKPIVEPPTHKQSSAPPAKQPTVDAQPAARPIVEAPAPKQSSATPSTPAKQLEVQLTAHPIVEPPTHKQSSAPPAKQPTVDAQPAARPIVEPPAAKQSVGTTSTPAKQPTLEVQLAARPIVEPPAAKQSVGTASTPARQPLEVQPAAHPIVLPSATKQSVATAPARQPTLDVQPAARPTLEATRPAAMTPCVPNSIDDGWDSIAIKVVDAPEAVVPVASLTADPVAPVTSEPVAMVTAKPATTIATAVTTVAAMPVATAAKPVATVMMTPTAMPVAAVTPVATTMAMPVAKLTPVATMTAMPIDTVAVTPVAPITAMPIDTVAVAPVATTMAIPVATVAAMPVATVDVANDLVAVPVTAATTTTLATVVEIATASTTVADVEDSLDVSDASMTEVDDLAFASAQIERDLVVPFEDHASVSAVTVVARRGACSTEPDPFETVTAVESPDGFLLALMRRDDGRAAPATLEAAVGASPRPTLANEPIRPSVHDRFTPAVTERAFASPAIASATFSTTAGPVAAPSPFAASPFASSPFAPSPFASSPFAPSPVATSDAPLDAPFAMHALDPATLAVAPLGATRPWRWVAAAGVFAMLLCATVATTVLIHSPAAAVPPSTTFAPAHESQLDGATVATARDQAPPVAVAPKKPPVHVIAAPPPIVRNNPRARPSTVERPSPRPRPAARPLRQPAAKKCKNLGCL